MICQNIHLFISDFRVPTKASSASIWQAKELRKLQAFDPCSEIPRSDPAQKVPAA